MGWLTGLSIRQNTPNWRAVSRKRKVSTLDPHTSTNGLLVRSVWFGLFVCLFVTIHQIATNGTTRQFSGNVSGQTLYDVTQRHEAALEHEYRVTLSAVSTFTPHVIFFSGLISSSSMMHYCLTCLLFDRDKVELCSLWYDIDFYVCLNNIRFDTTFKITVIHYIVLTTVIYKLSSANNWLILLQ